MAVSRAPAGRKERQWLGFNVDRRDLSLDQTSRETLGNPLTIFSLSLQRFALQRHVQLQCLCDPPAALLCDPPAALHVWKG